MSYLPWRLQVSAIAAVVVGLAQAIDISLCSTENTGSDSAPNTYNLQSLGHCRDQCGGRAFAIAQGKNCWCSDYAPSTTVDDGSCNQPCPGYPYELCGSSGSAYSYLQLGEPKGTGGPSAFVPQSSAAPAPSQPAYTPDPETIYQTVENTVVSSNVVVRTTAVVQTSVYIAPASTAEADTVTQVQTSLVAVTQRPITRVQTSLIAVTQRPSTQRARTQTQVLTVSGAVQTRYITSPVTATASPPSGSSADVQQESQQGLSNGAVAGLTVGVIAAAAIAGLFFFFCCWRRRKSDKEADAGGLNRNTSVLSKVGLLRHGSTRPGVATSTPAAVGGAASSAPRLDTNIPRISGPSSSASGGGMLERRDSRPLFRDQRLNPNALMIHSDTSRTSVGTLQDDKDYSRPLEVRNPDQSKP